jgi:hypothetical protein
MAKAIASKKKPKRSIQTVSKGEMEQLLADQASMILDAVGEKPVQSLSQFVQPLREPNSSSMSERRLRNRINQAPGQCFKFDTC